MTSKSRHAKALKWQELVATWNEILSDYWASHDQVTAISVLGEPAVWINTTPWPAAEWDFETKELMSWSKKKSSKSFIARLYQDLNAGVLEKQNT